jgi:hypothetical protein
VAKNGFTDPIMNPASQAGLGENETKRMIDPGGFVWNTGPSVPTAPDFQTDAAKQGMSTIPNQSNPFASSQWSVDPTTGQRTQNVSLNGGLAQGASNLMGQIGSQGSLPTGQQARDQAISAAYGQAMSRLNPEWNQRETQTRSQLAAQGLDPTTQAAQAQMDTFNRGRNDAEMGAMNSAIGQGTVAGQAIFNQGVTSQELPYQQLGQLQGLAGGFASGTQATPYATADAAKYTADMQGYGAQQAGKNSKMSGAASAVPAVAAMF